MTLPDILCALVWAVVAIAMIGRRGSAAGLAAAVVIAWMLPELLPVAVLWHRAVIAHALLAAPRWWPRTWTARMVLVIQYAAAAWIAPWLHPLGAAALSLLLVAGCVVEQRTQASRAGITAAVAAAVAFAAPLIIAPAGASAEMTSWLYAGALAAAAVAWAFDMRARPSAEALDTLIELDVDAVPLASRDDMRRAAQLRAAHRVLREEVDGGVRELTDSRARLADAAMRAGADVRERIEREVQEPLRVLAGRTIATTDGARERERAAREQLGLARQDIDALIRGLAPPGIDRGLAPALADLARASPVAVTVDAETGRLDDRIARAAYFVCAEALANVQKHSGAERASIRARIDEGMLEVAVSDDGHGGADVHTGTGLASMRDRVESSGGVFDVETGDEGTTIRAAFPVAMDAAKVEEASDEPPEPTAHRPAVTLMTLAAFAVAGAVAAWWMLAASPTRTTASLGAALAAVAFAAVAVASSPLGIPGRFRVGTAAAVLSLSATAVVAVSVPGVPWPVRLIAAATLGLASGGILHLALAIAASGRYPRSERFAVPVLATIYGAGAAFAAAWLSVTEPARDRLCRLPCAVWNIPPFESRTASDAFAVALTALAMLAAALTIAVVVRAFRREQAGIRAALVLTALAPVLRGVAGMLPDPHPLVGARADSLLGAVLWVSLVVLAATLLVEAVRGIRRTAVARRVIEDLAHDPSPGSLARSLSKALRDPDLRIDYWLPNAGTWVDGYGAAAPQRPDEPVAIVTRHGAPLARMRGEAVLPSAELEARLGAAARLVLDNERHLAERLAQREELVRSRQRILQASDAARRRTERDLHDGAQQRLLVASAHLRQAIAAEAPDATALDEDLAALLDIIERLRTISRGIYPPVLADAGLVPTLESLARTASIPLAVSAQAIPRLDPPLEHTVYLLVRDAAAFARTGDRIAVALRKRNEHLTVDVTGADGYREGAVDDRLEALGAVRTDLPDGVRWEIPCA